MKSASVFYHGELVARLRANMAREDWARQMAATVTESARPWLEMSDDALWSLMFGPAIPRSWMVWSNGHCPACAKPATMYNWIMDGLNHPWKTRCPHCKELFPKNDFHAFYTSGLDARGVFDPKRADRTLLFNAAHPDPADPLRSFGVDDGDGYVEGENRWRFIGAYLIYGQWKQVVLGGVRALSHAYVVSGDPVYARKAAILLDRVADLYPTFDFATQGYNYEKRGTHGYLGNWHDACEETRELALAYDMIFDGIKLDPGLPAFLSRKARQYGLENPKTSFADVQRNIESGILGDALANPHKIYSNYPRQEIALILMRAILGRPGAETDRLIDAMLEQATAVDGVTGEKGLANYSAAVIQALAVFLALWDRADEGFLQRCLDVQPRLRQTYRFHIDTLCLGKYYPLVGDTGWFPQEIGSYCGVAFRHPAAAGENARGRRLLAEAPLAPSMFSFLWRLHRLTGDPAFAQTLYLANGETADGLPHDLFAANGRAVRDGVAQVIAAQGPMPVVGGVNKEQWNLAILRAGVGEHARAAWLNYGVEGNHRHADGMNLGLFAFGLDLMPDLGYPPVQYGGWHAPRARWYMKSAAHNTVVVDGRDHASAPGRTTLWADGRLFKAIRAEAPGLIPPDALLPEGQPARRFERTIVLVAGPAPDRFYLLDIFRVVGGLDHARFMHSAFAELATEGLTLAPGEAYGHETRMRDFRWDRAPRPGWRAEWRLLDHEARQPHDPPIRLRYTDFTAGAQTATAEGWTALGGFGDAMRREAWIPCLVVRRRSDTGVPAASTFVGIIEPYRTDSDIRAIRRLTVTAGDGRAGPEDPVAMEVTHTDGAQDLIVAAGEGNGGAAGSAPETECVWIQRDWDVALGGELCVVRRVPAGAISYVAAAHASSIRIHKREWTNERRDRLLEWHK